MTRRRRFPSIFEEMLKRMRKEMERGFSWLGEEEIPEESIWDPFGEMMDWFERESPEDLEKFVTEEETPQGKVRRYGPFVYGFSYTKRSGEEPEIQEFGNVKPSGRGEIRPTPRGEREPLTEVVDLNGRYEITVEVPGVKKDEIDLSATEDTMKVETTGERKYQKTISFEDPIDPDKVDANFRNGILTVEAEKKEKEEKKGKEIEVK